jgi:hypothetical protein
MKLLPFVFLALSGSLFSQTYLIQEDFESGIPMSYSLVDNDGYTPASAVSEFTEAWISYQEPGNPTNNVAASTSYFDPAGVSDRWLILPQLNLGAFGNTISWEARSHDPSFPDSYLVMVSTTDDQLASFIDTIGYVQEEYDDWTYRTVDLSNEGYNSQSIYIAFINYTYDGFKLYLDNIEVTKDDPASIIENTIDINVYPNPSRDIITIQCNEVIDQNIILDLQGNKVAEFQTTSYSIAHLNAGVYILQSTISGKRSSIRIVKF